MKLNIASIFTILLVSISIRVEAENLNKYSDCENQKNEKQTLGTSLSMSQIGTGVLVARKSIHSIEKNGKVIVQVEQNFESGKNKLKCLNSKEVKDLKPLSSYIFAPTILDLADYKNSKNVIWQFRMSLDNSRIGLWNSKSRIGNLESRILEILSTDSSETQILIGSINSNLIQIQFTKVKNELTENLIVTYDKVSDI